MTEYGPDFQAAIAKLRASSFSDRPFRVHVVSAAHITKLVGTPSNNGCYVEGNKLGLIYVSKGLAYYVAVETLLHEYAHHVDTTPGETSRKHHRRSWGKTYAAILEYFHGT